ncbi:transcriptional regulator [Nitrosopumilus cobalaminigenes]|uniref:Transcriptional regulator n=1 Tax=Nitrosopumilus cobalaminigenes TaxID=1470066 RepID=A0A7D5M3K1_9ARCH|nr:P-II family nitrogen regulator [Nitrosopumilus cobalaminigenes]QLH03690.1 transcriptional regulator [Nitrosopumilus cobalaminigenes]
MKKIEAVIKRKNFPTIKTNLAAVGTYIIDKRNLDDSNIYDESLGSRAGSTGLKSVPLAKIEMVVSDKDARKVVEMISKNSGLSSNHGGKIFVSEMEEVVDMETLDGQQDLEIPSQEKIETKQLPKRSRFVPLQKFTLNKLQMTYEENKETLRDDYRIKSFSDFVNYCIMKSLPTIEKQLKNPTIIYENNFGDF